MSQEVVAVLSKIVFESEQRDFLVAEFIDVLSAKRFRASGKIQISPNLVMIILIRTVSTC